MLPEIGQFEIIYKIGTSAADKKFLESVCHRISGLQNPVILVFFGNCELTSKKENFISVKKPTDDNVKNIIENYKKYRSLILKDNRTATVKFIECPYYSPKKYNSTHNSDSVTAGINTSDREVKKQLQVEQVYKYP